MPTVQKIYIVVRIGATLITFSSLSLPAKDSDLAQIPQPVLTAQLKNLS